MAEPVSTTAVVFFGRQVLAGLLAGPVTAEQNRLLLEASTRASIEFNARRRETQGFFGFGVTAEDLAPLAAQQLGQQVALDIAQQIEQAANIMATRPAAQLTREPVPVVLPTAPVVVAQGPAPQLTREPVPVDTGDDEMANGFELIPFLNSVGSVASAFGGLFGGDSGGARAQQVALGPAIGTAGRMATRGTGALSTSFLGLGGGNGTPLSRARDATGRRVSRRQIINAARHCGLELAASTFGLSVEDVCMIVAKGMPRRSRGISSTDMRRTRSTLTKMNTMQKSLKSLCPPVRRRS